MHRQTKVWHSEPDAIHRVARERWLALVAGLLLGGGWIAVGQPGSQAARQQGTATAKAAADQAQVRVLESGQSIAREMAGGETHAYRITLAAGQFLHVVVEQHGIDVVVRVLDPAGKQVAEVDGPNGAQGPEPVYLVAEVQGSHLLEVRSLERAAPRGRYELIVKEVRTATAQDVSRGTAQKFYAEGMQGLGQRSKESLLIALKKFEEALRHYRVAGDRPGEADALTRIADVYAESGENRKALEYYDLVLPLVKAVGDRKAEAIMLNNIALVYNDLGEKQRALDYYNQALQPTRDVGDRRGEAITLNNMGLVYESLGEKQQALDYFNTALPLRRALGDRRGEAITLNNIGLVYESLGEGQQALDYYNRALPFFKTLGDRRGEAITLTNIGKVYASSNEQQRALEYLNQALLLHKAVGNRVGEASTLNNIARIYITRKEQQKALEHLNLALPLWKAVGDRRGEAGTLNNIGDSFASSGEKRKALEYYHQALPLLRAVGDRRGEAATLSSIAYVERDAGNLLSALEAIESALSLIEFIRTNVGAQDLRASYFATVHDYYQLFIDIQMRLHALDPAAGHDAAALQANERARARSLLELLTEARADIRQGVDPRLSERERDLRQQLNAKVEHQFRLLSAGHTAEQAAVVAGEIDALTGDLQQVQARLRVVSPAYAALTQPQPFSVRQIQQQVLDPKTLLLAYSLGEERSYMWLVSQTSLNSFTLPKRSEIEAAAFAFMCVLTEGGTPEEFDRAAAALSEMLLAPAAPYLGRRRLVIVADGALQYVPFAALPRPPERGRLRASRPLIASHEIISLPSASTLAALRRQVAGRRPAAMRLAVLADPVFTSDDSRVKATTQDGKAARAAAATPERVRRENERASEAARALGLRRVGADLRRLPFSRYEAERLLALVPRGEALAALDFAASQATAMSAELRRYRIIHFATHGYLNPERPDLSGLVLSLVDQQGAPRDGFLSLTEVYNLRLDAELLVLSGCQTGLGKPVSGEGLVGLTRGFMYAGSPRVVASLWAVEDRATAELMARFYTAMLKRRLRPAAALRAAQLSMLSEARWSDPHKWAGFIFQGEWR
jgi:CHAT domain-containing protein/tetratricopeptide (TPR) repeat protein